MYDIMVVFSLRKYKWWVRNNRVVFRENLGQEYANGRDGINNIKGQLRHKGIGGKTTMKEKVSHPEGPTPETIPISSKPSADQKRSILLKRTGDF